MQDSVRLWQKLQSEVDTEPPDDDMHEAAAVRVAVPQLGHPVHWPRVQKYVTQGARLQLRVWL